MAVVVHVLPARVGKQHLVHYANYRENAWQLVLVGRTSVGHYRPILYSGALPKHRSLLSSTVLEFVVLLHALLTLVVQDCCIP